MKKYFYIILLAIFSINCIGSDSIILKEYDSSEFRFAGYQDKLPIYYNKNITDYKFSKYTNSLWKAIVNSNGKINFEFIKQIDNKKGDVIYVHNELIIYYSFIGNGEYEFIIEYENKELIRYTSKLTSFHFSLNEKNKSLYFPIKKFKEPQIVTIDLNETPITIKKLPLFGSHPVVNDQFLYFSSTLVSNTFSSLPYDLYRVQLDDWNKTELIYENIENEEWSILPNGLIFLHTFIKDYKHKDIVLNINNLKYDLINTKQFSNIIKYNGEYYIEKKVLSKNSNNKIYSYEKVIINQFEGEFSIEDKNIKRKIILNLHIDNKKFNNTFINEELLYNLTSKELSELTKEELRLLRNAFFALQGYQFKSKDLQEFFGQFEWYHKMVERNKYLELPNEDVVISPKDKERVDLILEIENSK